ncbi:MAG: creatininase family protein [Anaerolineaceae bacterium]|nr:creatininase family protein [Anaerolineaceae bacterium]
MRIDDLNWMDVERYLEQDERIMLVLGSCEQHGYLSLLTDVRIPQALADAASQESHVLVGPALNFGVSPYFMSFPGTISLRSSTYLSILDDLITSLVQHGFHKILIVNGHGGNHIATTLTDELLNRYDDLQIKWYSWWQAPAVLHICKKHDLKPAHAAWLEAFPFAMVGELPQEGKVVADAETSISATRVRELFPEGVMGSPYQVDMKIMDEIFKAALANILHMLKFED